jgi:hypothetical protein
VYPSPPKVAGSVTASNLSQTSLEPLGT